MTLDGANGASGAANTTLQWSHTVTATTDSILMLAFSYEDGIGTVGADPDTITYGTQGFTKLVSVNSTNGPTINTENVLSIWYLMNPLAGTAMITIPTVVLDSPANLMRGSSASFAGVTAVPTVFATKATNDNTQALLTFTGVPSGSALYNAVGFSGSSTGIGTTSPVITVPTNGSFTGGQASHHSGYNLDVSGDFTAGATGVNQRVVQAGVILVPEPGSLIMLGLSGLLLVRRKR